MLDQPAEARAEPIFYTPPSRPLVIRGSRWKALRSAAFAFAIGILFVAAIGRQPAALLPILFGIVIIMVGIGHLYRAILPGRLTADAEGLRWHGLGRAWQVEWRDIVGFRVVRTRRVSRVVIDYSAPDNQVVRRTGRQPALPGMLEFNPVWVCDLLNHRLAVARTHNPAMSPETLTVAAVREPVAAIPWMSAGLAVVLLLVFLAELYFPVSAATGSAEPSLLTLLGFGANAGNLVLGQSQWYRLATAPFLHANTLHLVFNCIGLLLAGRLLEGLVGRAWFATIYAMGAVGGGFGSLLFNAPNVASVGASGAIMALFGATFVCSFHFSRTPARDRLQARAMFVLAPTLLTMGKTSEGLAVDFGAHLGGTAAGALIGILLLRLWARDGERPRRQKLALAIASIGALSVAAAIPPTTTHYKEYRALAWLTAPPVK